MNTQRTAEAMAFHIEAVGDMDTGRAHLCVVCPRGHDGVCRTSLWEKPAAGIMWQWNGDFGAPTITPSINCLGGCGRHFTITNGAVS